MTRAIEKAQELAGERTVAVNPGDVGGQILAAGLVVLHLKFKVARWKR